MKQGGGGVGGWEAGTLQPEGQIGLAACFYMAHR